MTIALHRELKPIKAGWQSGSPLLRLTAHGHTQEEADRNLERGVRLFLRPFQRTGTLEQELDALGLKSEGDANDLQIVLH